MSRSERQREGERWAMIRASGGVALASGNQATKRGYSHRPAPPPGIARHIRVRDPIPQARPMSGRARLASYGAETVEELTGPQRRRFNAKMNRQLNQRAGIARTLRGRQRPQQRARQQAAQPENLVAAAEVKTLLQRINQVWRRDRNLQKVR